MTNFPDNITPDEALTMIQTAIGNKTSSGKFANNKNNLLAFTPTAVTCVAVWNYVFHQGIGSGVEYTNYVYGRDNNGNVRDLLDPPEDRIFYNPTGDGTNSTYGLNNKGLTGVVNHGLYTHWRKITVNSDGIDKIEAPLQSFLTSPSVVEDDTRIYGTDWTTVILNKGKLAGSEEPKLNNLLEVDLSDVSYRLDTKSATSTAFSEYVNITNNNLGAESYYLAGMYDVRINVNQNSGVFSSSTDSFNGTDSKGPKIYADKFETNKDTQFDTTPMSFNGGGTFIPRLVINNSPLLSSIDINLSQGQTPVNGFVDSNIVTSNTGVLKLNAEQVKTAVGDDDAGPTYNSVHISPLADSALFNSQYTPTTKPAKATNTPNTVPGEIVAFNINTSQSGPNSTFHGVKIPVTPPGVHLGGMGLRVIFVCFIHSVAAIS